MKHDWKSQLRPQGFRHQDLQEKMKALPAVLRPAAGDAFRDRADTKKAVGEILTHRGVRLPKGITKSEVVDQILALARQHRALPRFSGSLSTWDGFGTAKRDPGASARAKFAVKTAPKIVDGLSVSGIRKRLGDFRLDAVKSALDGANIRYGGSGGTNWNIRFGLRNGEQASYTIDTRPNWNVYSKSTRYPATTDNHSVALPKDWMSQTRKVGGPACLDHMILSVRPEQTFESVGGEVVPGVYQVRTARQGRGYSVNVEDTYIRVWEVQRFGSRGEKSGPDPYHQVFFHKTLDAALKQKPPEAALMLAQKAQHAKEAAEIAEWKDMDAIANFDEPPRDLGYMLSGLSRRDGNQQAKTENRTR